ncbi:16S rRNA (guanine(966)-N(2))-methyltransferase RsmD [Thorsellia anophelis]|uniref:Ribosomal RNA small subunit methyltransferase D n=1 Tax=Thorsellia anophelis DSM 18579 TaxID=1123402 RepID=A0A1I0A7J1_9GAMM|nr:16S rRNA (guanine(966)-N(2))-methyltransferase RsmD [Thorsellia anophelis]SES90138.1 16S rRNA (guanine966-N2)-methyltransferase [Thorsellia anophelis DSM 18579]
MIKNNTNVKTGKQSSKKNEVGQIRVIGGKWRGRKLPVVSEEGLRPTGDRMKETLFNWLMHDLTDANCLDLFAGSGALGFEAASRYAGSVTFIEKSKIAAITIKENIAKLSANNLIIFQMDALEYLNQKPSKPFDIIFIDPPFRKGLLGEVLIKLTAHSFAQKGSRIYIETEREAIIEDIPNDWFLIKEKNTGQVCHRLFEHG